MTDQNRNHPFRTLPFLLFPLRSAWKAKPYLLCRSFLPWMQRFHHREPGGTKMQIPLNGQPQWTPSCLKLNEREVAQLLLEPHNPAEEHVGPVKLDGIPGPLAIGSEKLAEHQ